MVSAIQEQLEAIYQIHCEHRAVEFLVSKEVAKALGGTCRADEELLLCDQSGELEVALYLAPALLEKLAQMGDLPAAQILERDLDSYCQVAEGVSHFLYLAQTADQHRTVSLLEMEIQAEIDKFASCVFNGWPNLTADWVNTLHHRLFDWVTFSPQLSSGERWRYQEANRLSGNYCRALIPLVLTRHYERFLHQLRYSYRLGAEAKLRHLSEVR